MLNIDARFSMVTFSGNKTTGMWGQGDTKTWDDAEVAVSWTTDAGTIEERLQTNFKWWNKLSGRYSDCERIADQ